ncbi:MAG: amidohydrolase [Planctomycetota bacterium]
MRWFIGSSALLFLLGCSGTPPADIVFRNGYFHTLNPQQTAARAVAARDGVIVFVGATKNVHKWVGPETRVIDLDGAIGIPGLTDAHMHLSGVGRETMTLNLKGTESLTDLLRHIEDQRKKINPGEWIVGRGWNETHWTPPEFPTRHDLDAVAPKNPVWLSRVDGHGAVANSEALRLAGITAATQDPPGGEILRSADGEATGMLLDNAQDLVSRHLPSRGKDFLRRSLVRGAREYASRGWTAVQIAGTSWNESELIETLVAQNEIPLRVYNAIMGPGADAERLLNHGPTGIGRDSDFTRRTIKVSLDGALGSGGAALLENYSDRPGSGFLKHTDEVLLPMLEKALRRGIQVEVHAIGDRANRHILDLYEETFRRVPVSERKVADPRWRVEHAQIVSPVDIPRFARLKVIPSMQPSHAITDLHFAPSRLGAKRLEGAYAWRSFLDHGCIIPGGSDAPVEAGEPMVEFYAAVARRDLKGFSGPGWHPEQAISRKEALKMLTLWPAQAAFEEAWRGSIELGKACDLTFLSRDPLAVPLDEIPRIRCRMTVVAGKVVYDSRKPQ